MAPRISETFSSDMSFFVYIVGCRKISPICLSARKFGKREEKNIFAKEHLLTHVYECLELEQNDAVADHAAVPGAADDNVTGTVNEIFFINAIGWISDLIFITLFLKFLVW